MIGNAAACGGGPTRSRVRLAPSILAADWSRLADEVGGVAAAGADWIHVDVMDGQFVPALSAGPKLVAAVRSLVDLPCDVHLMVHEPEHLLADFAAAGANLITVHAEASHHVHRLVAQIRRLGVLAGVAVNPGTPLDALDPLWDEIDLALIMTVDPGWGGQPFWPGSAAKIGAAERARGGRPVLLEVDGGIDKSTAPVAVLAGADVLVAGSAVFGHGDPGCALAALRSSIT